MPKTITDSQIIGSQGESLVSERANAMGFMFTPHGPIDAGIDGFLEIRDPQSRAATGQIVAVQVKTTAAGRYTSESEAAFEYLMDENDVSYWQGCNLPVIVVLVHLQDQTAYWKSCDSGQGPGSRRLSIDKVQDVFDSRAREAIAHLCVAKGGFGVYFPPLKTSEKGHLNMLEVILPETIYLAPSPFQTGGHAIQELLQHDERPPDDWVIRRGQFMSFRDPRHNPTIHIVDPGAIEDFASDEVALPDDEAREHTIIDLLTRTLVFQLSGVLSFSRPQRAFYFPALPETIDRIHSYSSLKQHTSATVVKKYLRDGTLKYVRHHAFEPRFWMIQSQWFLSIAPTFVFTCDGSRPDMYASGRLAGKKQREFNSALVGQFTMWRHLLAGTEADCVAGALFPTEPDSQLLRFKSLTPLEIPHAVPDELWRQSDVALPSQTAQLRLQV